MFQMKRKTFYRSVSMLRPHIVRQETNMHWAIQPDKRVVVAIMKLASPSSLQNFANQFGMSACTAGWATQEVSHLLKEITLNKIIHLANPQQVIDGFNTKGVPNCVGALDSTHIPVPYPVGRGRAFTNRKGYASMTLQAVVDPRGWFINTYTGWVSSMHNVHMFRNSPLPCLMEKGHYAPNVEETVIHNVTIPLVILADAAYPLKPWLMKPYEGNVTNLQKPVFNTGLNSFRMGVECAFGQMKGRWRMLTRCLKMEQENIIAFVVAGCMLYNICESYGEVCMES
ncbi:PREDICTED: putative nuclease HARBI1 [Crocodylus porosus]|uniref:putative nuclease HARBI1 n=1 Tax=Crocodylus porosus TaxID=8502 RepID=UPI00093FF08C|nr:PREDICTED: putative nuclease HARBI1 [Crocodylus porosus]